MKSHAAGERIGLRAGKPALSVQLPLIVASRIGMITRPILQPESFTNGFL